ncbi:MAG: hypothetical protein WDN49_18965 [Acetobacteraceae bacterium]
MAMSEKVAVPLSAAHDEVGVVGIMAHHVARRHDGARLDIVGQVQQGRHQRLVAGHDLLHQRLPPLARALDDEAALGADRHDDGVLHHLRLHQTEDFGAEILLAVGPSNAAARDLAAAQMAAFHARRIHEDFHQRARQRQQVDLLAGELDREIGPRLPVRVALVVIRPQRLLDQQQEAAENPVLVEVLDLREAFQDARMDRRRVRNAVSGGERRVGPDVEQAPPTAARGADGRWPCPPYSPG